MIPNAEQIHILGSKQDIQGFKDFVNTTESTTKSFDELISTGEIQYVDEETGDLCAKFGGKTNFHRGGKWELVKDLKGFPTHEKGGVDLVIGKNGVSIKNVNSDIKHWSRLHLKSMNKFGYWGNAKTMSYLQFQNFQVSQLFF